MSASHSCELTFSFLRRSSKRKSISTTSASGLRALPDGLHVLLGLEQRAEERDAAADLAEIDAGLLERADPVDQLAGRRPLAQARRRAQAVEHLDRLVEHLVG